MAERSPMSYFADSKTTQQQKPKTPKAAKTKSSKADFTNAYKRHERIKKDIDSIAGYPTVVKKLSDWNEKQMLRWVRKEAGLDETKTLPEILFVTGGGSTERAYDHMADFCWRTGFLASPWVSYYDVNKFVKHYVADSELMVQDAFSANPARLVCFHGFEELIANPRPPMADWFDWVDIIVNLIIDNVDKAEMRSPVIFELSRGSYQHLNDRFTRLKKFDLDQLHIPYLKPYDLARFISKDIKAKKYIMSPAAECALDALVKKCLMEKDVRQMSETNLINNIMKAVLDKQGERIKALPQSDLTARKVKTICAEDIPGQPIFLQSQVIFY